MKGYKKLAKNKDGYILKPIKDAQAPKWLLWLIILIGLYFPIRLGISVAFGI